jgi:hypothetical protein
VVVPALESKLTTGWKMLLVTRWKAAECWCLFCTGDAASVNAMVARNVTYCKLNTHNKKERRLCLPTRYTKIN